MITGKGHRRVAAEGNYVLVFLLVLREFSLGILLPNTLQFLLSIGSTMQKLDIAIFSIIILKLVTLKKPNKKAIKKPKQNPTPNSKLLDKKECLFKTKK